MSHPPSCPRCFAPILPSESPGGLCPKCMIAVAMGEDGMIRSAFGSPVLAPPGIDELSPHFPGLEIFALVGRGGSGAVYRAIQKDLGRVIALKVLLLDPANDPAFGERFAREARAMAKLHHPNIASVHDAGRAGPYWFLTMEFVDGANLRQVLRQGQMSAADALDFTRQICAALEYAHGMGVVHRDIKPENVLVDESGAIKLVDFGLAKLVGANAEAISLTGASQAMGTWRYMAPEQLNRPREVDHRADIFSLGVVLYELLTGEVPQGRYAPLSSRAKVDRRLDDVVDRTLEQDPDRRYQQVSGVGEDLDSIGRGSSEPLQGAPSERSHVPGPEPEPEEAAGLSFRELKKLKKMELEAQRGCFDRAFSFVFWAIISLFLFFAVTALLFGACSVEPEPMISNGAVAVAPDDTPVGVSIVASQIRQRLSPEGRPHQEVETAIRQVAFSYVAAERQAITMTRIHAPDRSWLQIDFAAFPDEIARLQGFLLESVGRFHGVEARSLAEKRLAAQSPFPYGTRLRSFEYEKDPEVILRELGGREYRKKDEIRDVLPFDVRRRLLSRTLPSLRVGASVARGPKAGLRSARWMERSQASLDGLYSEIERASHELKASPHWARVIRWQPDDDDASEIKLESMRLQFADRMITPVMDRFLPGGLVREPFTLYLHADGKGVIVPFPAGEVTEDPNDRVELHPGDLAWIELISRD